MQARTDPITVFMSGQDKQFLIPVYQRNYNWKKMINVKHCGMICYISGIPVVMFRIFSVPLLVYETTKAML